MIDKFNKFKTFKIFESDNFDEIVSYLEDVLIDMTDDRLSVNIKQPSFTVRDREGNKNDLIEISISGKFNPTKYINSFDHLNSYLESQGYTFYSNGTMYDNYLQKRNSISENRLLSYLSLTYRK